MQLGMTNQPGPGHTQSAQQRRLAPSSLTVAFSQSEKERAPFHVCTFVRIDYGHNRALRGTLQLWLGRDISQGLRVTLLPWRPGIEQQTRHEPTCANKSHKPGSSWVPKNTAAFSTKHTSIYFNQTWIIFHVILDCASTTKNATCFWGTATAAQPLILRNCFFFQLFHWTRQLCYLMENLFVPLFDLAVKWYKSPQTGFLYGSTITGAHLQLCGLYVCDSWGSSIYLALIFTGQAQQLYLVNF